MELSTERLTLRPYAVTDFEESAAVWGDAEVVRYMGQPATREMSWYRTLRYVGHWSAFGYGMFAVRDRAGRFMGDVGISDFHRDIDPPNGPSLRVAAKHGFVETRRAVYHGDEVIVFTRPRTPGRASRATT